MQLQTLSSTGKNMNGININYEAFNSLKSPKGNNCHYLLSLNSFVCVFIYGKKELVWFYEIIWLSYC